MSVLVRGMEMPNNCEECDIHFCKLWMRMTIRQRIAGKHPDCPCIEVKTPHGRLIEADKLNTYDISLVNGFCVIGVTEEDIGLAETILEAEGSSR